MMRLVQSYIELSKPKPTLLAAFTVLCGFVVGSGGDITWSVLISTVIAGLLIGSGANASNQIMEVDFDAQMQRTESRPLVQKRISKFHALVYATVVTLSGLMIFATAANFLTVAVALALFISYVFIYTPLKRKSVICVYVGAVSGALPPCLGWAAAQNQLTAETGLLFLILFCWQIPHFYAIAWLYRESYEKAGYCMPAGNQANALSVVLPVILFNVALVLLTLGLAALEMLTPLLTALSIALGALFLASGIRFILNKSNATAAGVVRHSIIYLCCVLIFLMVSSF